MSSSTLLLQTCLAGILGPIGGAYEIPLWLKLAYTLLVAIVIPIYVRHWGWANFLWFSDIAFIALAAALWLEIPLLVSMMAVGVLLFEIGWTLSFLLQLLTGKSIGGLTDYMFNGEKPLYVRLLSLFHLLLPPLMVWLLYLWGYDGRAWLGQSLLTLVVLLIIYFFTDPNENINWAFGLASKPQKRIPSGLYLALWIAFLCFGVYLPTHFLLRWLFGCG